MIGDWEGHQDASPWRDLAFPRLEESSSKTSCTSCLRPLQAFHGGLLPCWLPCRGDQVHIVLRKGPKGWVLFVATESLMGMLPVAVSRVVLKWPARWLGNAPWPWSPTRLQSTDPVPVAHFDTPGYSKCFFLLEYSWVIASSDFNSSSADKKILKLGEMYHVFLLVNYMQFHQQLGLVIVVVTTNSGEVVRETLLVASEARLVTYHMASMLQGEVEHTGLYLCSIWITNEFEDATYEDVRAFPFEMFHRWRVRALSLLNLRFNGIVSLQPGSVMLTKIYSSVGFNLRCTSLADLWESRQDTIGEHIGLRSLCP